MAERQDRNETGPAVRPAGERAGLPEHGPDEGARTRRALLQDAARLLERAGIVSARRNAEWLLEEVLRCSRAQLYAYAEQEVTPDEAQAFRALLTRRLRHEPLQYILGYTEFYGLRLAVTPAVLIPRPETEQVVEEALGLLPPGTGGRVLDVGTGSGCIALALKHERPAADVYGCDVSAEALEVAAANAASLGLDVTFLQADVRRPDFPERAPADLDLVVSNPPYIARREAPGLDAEVVDHEPHLALFAGEDPLAFYRIISQHALRLLAPAGYLVYETHADHAGEVRELLVELGYAEVRLRHDLADLPRIVSGRRAP